MNRQARILSHLSLTRRLNVNALPTQVRGNQYPLWTLHCGSDGDVTWTFQGSGASETRCPDGKVWLNPDPLDSWFETNAASVWSSRRVSRDFLLLWPIWWSCELWHITGSDPRPHQYSVRVSTHNKQMALLLFFFFFLHKPGRNCYNSCIQSTTSAGIMSCRSA